jgi:hypothetical protein
MKPIAIGAIACAIALLFPPWGFGGSNFESFAFLFSNSVPVKGFPNLTASIVPHVLIGEIAIIICLTIAAHFASKGRPTL